MAQAHLNINNVPSAALRSWNKLLGYGLPAFLLLFITFTHSAAQNCIRQVRKYADVQGKYETVLYVAGIPTLSGSITNDGLATDGNPATGSTLNMPLSALGLASVTQFLQFTTNGATPRAIPAGTSVTVKIAVPSSLLGVLSGVEIGSFSGLHTVSANTAFVGLGNKAGVNATTTTQYYTGTTLVDALNAAGEVEISFSPADVYNGVYVKLTASLISLALSSGVYHAFIMEDATTSLNCEERIDVLSGIKGNALANLASATGSVTNPFNTVDADASLSTYSTMTTGAQVLSNVFQTVIFSTPSVAGDSLQVVVQSPGGGLLDLNLLTGFTIQPYLGTTPVGPPLVNNPSFLSLRLLPGSSDKYIITAAVSGAFDRVEIIMGGVAAALAELRVYDVSRVRRSPVSVLTLNGLPGPAALCASQASQVTLGISNRDTCTTYTWYDANNNLVTTGHSMLPGVTAAGTHTYTVKAARNGCNNASLQSPISYTIHPTPATPVIPPVTVCTGQPATLTLSNPETGISYYWYNTASGNTPPANAISSGTTYTTGTPPAFTTYYVAAYNAVTQCISDSQGQGNITIVPHPGPPSLSIQPH